MSQQPVPIHIGTHDLTWWDDIEARQRAQVDTYNVFLSSGRRPSAADPGLDWAGFGLEPRWVGYDSADCAAALHPNVFSGQGADEYQRFRDGAENRGELALVISLLGNTDTDQVRSSLSRRDDSVMISAFNTTISSRPLGKGARVRAADGLSGADAQLASRLITCQPPLPWRALTLDGMTFETYRGTEHHPAAGTLEAVVETELGEPVVAVWTSPDEIERRYVIPAETSWPVLLAWLTEKALPDLVPGAMRRARRHMANDPTLTTVREQAAQAAVAALDAAYARERHELLAEAAAAQAEASSVRDGLLYGTGSVLVDAVTQALRSAGINVVDLDELLGGTKNADLLCSFDGRVRLVEVKSASGNAKERLYDDLVGHLREWPTLARSSPVEGGALIVNHQISRPPQERDAATFNRPEFVNAQNEPVIATMQLFEAWRAGDDARLVGLLFDNTPGATTRRPTRPAAGSTDPAPRRSWRRRRTW